MPSNMRKKVLTQQKKRKKNKINRETTDREFPSAIERQQQQREKIKKEILKLRAKSPSPDSDADESAAENGHHEQPAHDRQHAERDDNAPMVACGPPGHYYEDADYNGSPRPTGTTWPRSRKIPYDYCPGGYYPVRLGEIFKGRYHVIRKVGWGHFSTVWLCWDGVSRRFVALKIVKAAENYAVSAADEIALLRVASAPSAHYGRTRVLEMMDSFKVHGVNGEHTCMVFEVLGCTLLKLIMESNYTGLPLNQVRIIIKQVLQGLSYLHDECKIIHTDLKPENILVEMTPAEIKDMAQQMINRIKHGIAPDVTEVCNLPMLPKKLSKNKKKKLRKKKKKQEEHLAQQLAANIIGPSDVHTDGDDPMKSLISQPLPAIPRINPKKLNGVNNGAPKDEMAESTVQEDENEVADSKVEGANAKKNKKKKKNRRKRKNGDNEASTVDPNNEMSMSAISMPVNDMSVSMSAANQPVEEDSSLSPKAAREQPKEVSPKPSRKRQQNVREPFREVGGLRGGGPPDEESEYEMQREKYNNNLFSLLRDFPGTTTTHLESNELPRVKIADLGNACWQDHHFTQDIQTRQYRALEVIIGSGYDLSADIWSVACIAFELAVGDYLFEPHTGPDYGRDEDHLAHIMELLGPIPYYVYSKGVYWTQYFRPDGRLIRISNLRPWSLADVLMQKYRWPEHHAVPFSNFLLELLHFDPQKRPTANEALKHPWINTPILDDPKDHFNPRDHLGEDLGPGHRSTSV
ncbi:BMA-SPK-1, isoform e [Aphelenchoides fujianensis]|nr:BMA-SPK-1, isoform e [Aphelenchoides fujianensis]